MKPGFCMAISITWRLANGVGSGVTRYPRVAIRAARQMKIKAAKDNLLLVNFRQAMADNDPDDS